MLEDIFIDSASEEDIFFNAEVPEVQNEEYYEIEFAQEYQNNNTDIEGDYVSYETVQEGAQLEGENQQQSNGESENVTYVCNCPDYSSNLSSIISYLQNLETSQDSKDVQDKLDLLITETRKLNDNIVTANNNNVRGMLITSGVISMILGVLTVKCIFYRMY